MRRTEKNINKLIYNNDAGETINIEIWQIYLLTE